MAHQARQLSWNADVERPLASTFKTIVLAAYAREVVAGRIDPERVVPVAEVERWLVEGTDGGSHAAMLDQFATPAGIRVDDLAAAMMQHSTNTAADALSHLIGRQAIADTAAELGLSPSPPPPPPLAARFSQLFAKEGASLRPRSRRPANGRAQRPSPRCRPVGRVVRRRRVSGAGNEPSRGSGLCRRAPHRTRTMKPAELADVVADLVVRVAALEAGRPPGRPAANGDLSIVRSLVSELADGRRGRGRERHRALRRRGDRRRWSHRLADGPTWNELTELEPGPIARLLAALGNPQRVQIVQALIHAPATTAELSGRLDEPSTGQLFHHLKELLAAGVVYQPQRGTYAIRQQHIVPLLTVMSCSLDLAR